MICGYCPQIAVFIKSNFLRGLRKSRYFFIKNPLPFHIFLIECHTRIKPLSQYIPF